MTLPTPADAGRPTAGLEAAAEGMAEALRETLSILRFVRLVVPEGQPTHRVDDAMQLVYMARCAGLEALEAHREAQASDLNSYAAHQATREE